MMAVAFSIWSLVFFLRNRKYEALFISPLLAVLAFYTKQTQVALPSQLSLSGARDASSYSICFSSCNRRLIPFLWLQKPACLFFFDTVELAKLAYKVL